MNHFRAQTSRVQLVRAFVRPVTVLAALVAASPGLPASAQQPTDTTRAIALEPVEVSILRTSMSTSSAPLAVASLGEVALRNARSGAFLEEALRGLPGVHVQNRYNFALGERLVVRGFGGRAQFGVRGVRLIVDGIPATLADGQGTLDHLDVGSLGRVEVVRGAASSLFGNASGGVVVFESRRPAEEPVRLEAEYVGGSHGLSRAQATASGTTSGTGYLVNLSTQDWDGYRTNPIGGTESVYGTADRIALNAQLRRALAAGELSLTVNYLDLDSQNPGELLKTQIDSLTRTAHAAGSVNNVVRAAGKEITQTQAGLRWEGALAGLDADLGVFGVARKTINPIVPTIIDLDRDAGGLRVHLSRALATSWGALRLHAGAEGEFMSDDRLNFVNDNGQRGNKTVDQRERVRSAGLFFQGDVPLPGSAQGLVGLRYDRLDFRAWDHIVRTGTDPSRTGERTMDRVSPSVGVNIPVGSSLNVFSNWGTVFETPSTTELGNRPDGEGGFNPDLEPQTGKSIEVGVRGRAAGLLSFEVSGYRTDLRNEIVRFQVATLPGRDFFRNAGRSRHTGVEATLAASSPNSVLDGRLTYTYTNARFREFVQDGVDVSGNRIPGLAPQRADAVLRFNALDRLPGFRGFGEVVTAYVDAVPVNDRNTEGFSAPSYVLVDLRGGLHGVRMARVTVSPWIGVTNLFDEYYVASVVPNAAAATPAAARYYDPGPGRSFQLGVRASWGPE